MGNGHYTEKEKEEYNQNMQHLSDLFREDEPITFKEHISLMWDETKNITKVWIGMGLASAIIFGSFAAYKHQSGKGYMRNEFLPSFKEKMIAQCHYNNNPSKENEINYLEKQGKLESLIRPEIVMGGNHPERYLEAYEDIFYSSNCQEPDLKNKSKKPCYVLFGSIIEKAELKKTRGNNKILIGKGYLTKNLEQHNIQVDKNFKTTNRYPNSFVIVANDSISKKDYNSYLKNELKKMILSDSENK